MTNIDPRTRSRQARTLWLMVAGIVLTCATQASAQRRSGFSLVPGSPDPVSPRERMAEAQKANIDAARRAVARAVDAAAKLRASDPALVEARRSVMSSLQNFRAVRDIALIELRRSAEYSQLVGRIYNAEAELAELHRDRFISIDSAMAAAKRVLDLRLELSQREAVVLQDHAEYLAAAEDLKLAAQSFREVQAQQRLSGWADGALLRALSRLEQESQKLRSVGN